jgi:hypothetical protein
MTVAMSSEPSGQKFWDKHWVASMSDETRLQATRTVKALQKRKRELSMLLDELDAHGGSEEEWKAYGQTFDQWNAEVVDLAEEMNMDLSSFRESKAPIEEVPLEGSRRIGKGAYQTGEKPVG